MARIPSPPTRTAVTGCSGTQRTARAQGPGLEHVLNRHAISRERRNSGWLLVPDEQQVRFLPRRPLPGH